MLLARQRRSSRPWFFLKFKQPSESFCFPTDTNLKIKIVHLHVLRLARDEMLTWSDRIAHENTERLIGQSRVARRHLQ